MASISALAISNSVILLILYNLASFPKYFISASNLVAFSAALIFLECVEELDSVEDFLWQLQMEGANFTETKTQNMKSMKVFFLDQEERFNDTRKLETTVTKYN